MRSITASTENSYSLAFSCVYVYDGNGNVTEYVNESGAVKAHYEYTPFGAITASSGDKKDTFTHRFSTKPYDADVGLVRYELRDYSATLGRWLSRDPIGEGGGLHLFVFLRNRPLDRRDMLGLVNTVFVVSGDEYIYTGDEKWADAKGKIKIEEAQFDSGGQTFVRYGGETYSWLCFKGITINLKIAVQKGLAGKKYNSGDVVYYGKHVNATDGKGVLSNGDLSSVKEHEYGHAKVVWEYLIPKLKEKLDPYRDKFVWPKTIQGIWRSIYGTDEYEKASAKYANELTIAHFGPDNWDSEVFPGDSGGWQIIGSGNYVYQYKFTKK